jgi:FolB domain-containing protein
MSQIRIVDLEVFYCVGVPEEERAKPQRLLISVTLRHDFSAAASSDRLSHTIDYFSISQFLLKHGEGRSWRLIEKLAVNLADHIMAHYKPSAVEIEVKKFVIPQAAFVSVIYSRER